MNTGREMSKQIRTLFVCSGNKGNISPFILDQKEALEAKGVIVEIFAVKGKGITGYLNSLKALQLRLKNENYDFIHAHYGLSGLLACLQLRVPVVLTLHGSDVNDPKVRVFSKAAAFLARKVIVVSVKMRSKLKSNYNAVEIIPCGVDMQQFRYIEKEEARKKLESSGKFRFKPSKHYILFSSSFDIEVKNPQLAKEAVAILGNDYELIELKGYSREEVALLLNAVDVALMTSRAEGSPQFIKEAMACNCPVVSTNVGDVKEIINHARGCFICEPDAIDVADKIRKATKFRQTKGRERMPSEYSKENVTEQIVKSYKEVAH